MAFDYLMNQIETMTRALAMIVMKREDISAEELVAPNGQVSAELFLRHTLEKMVKEGRVNQAENLLFRMLDEQHNPEFLTIGLQFYQNLLEMDQNKLQELGFSGDEIAEGLEDLARRFPIEEAKIIV